MKLKTALLSVILLAALATSADDMKVPADIGVRIRNVQLDQARQQGQITQLQAQYNQITTILQHDAGELDGLKKEALSTAKVDAEKYDVDVEKLVFVPKPKTPEKK